MMLLFLAALSAAPEPTLRAEFEPMRFLVGHCWRGALKKGAQQDTHCFEPVFDGQHIRDRHEVTGGESIYRGESLYSWNGKSGRVEYSYWNSLGGVSRGAMVPRPGLLDFGTDSYTSPDGRVLTMTTVWRKIDDRTYETVTTSAASTTGQRLVRFTRVD